MSICKHYVNNKCNRVDCKFKHIDNICSEYFFSNSSNIINCKNPLCIKSHEFKLNENRKSYNSKSNNLNSYKIINTETFKPDLSEPNIRIIINQHIKKENEVCIITDIFGNSNYYEDLLYEIDSSIYKSWHGDTHLIADDNINWKNNSLTFQNIINTLVIYFQLNSFTSRLNYYQNSSEWKPYHHDAAAIKPDKAKTQNITIGVSFGLEREISFQSATQNNKDERVTINFPLKDSYIYAFGNKVNIDFRHGIPQLKDKNNKGRISIILWGYSNYFNNFNNHLSI